MRTVKIGFSRPKNKLFPVFSWLIRLYERTRYSHVLVRWETSNKKWNLCYQASNSMVHFLGEELFNKEVELLEEYEFEITNEQYEQLLDFTIKNAGVSYSSIKVLGLVIAKFLGLKRNPLSYKKPSYFCSKLVAHIFKDIFYLEISNDIDLISPKEINKICKIYGKRIKK